MNKMKLSILFLPFLFLTGCCKFPFVDCLFPENQRKIAITPATIQFENISELTLTFQGRQVLKSKNDSLVYLDMDCQVVSKTCQIDLMSKCVSAQLLRSGQIKTGDIFLFSEKQTGGGIIKNYGIGFSGCCETYPLEFKIDSIPVIQGIDTSYVNANLTLMELMNDE